MLGRAYVPLGVLEILTILFPSPGIYHLGSLSSLSLIHACIYSLGQLIS